MNTGVPYCPADTHTCNTVSQTWHHDQSCDTHDLNGIEYHKYFYPGWTLLPVIRSISCDINARRTPIPVIQPLNCDTNGLSCDTNDPNGIKHIGNTLLVDT